MASKAIRYQAVAASADHARIVEFTVTRVDGKQVSQVPTGQTWPNTRAGKTAMLDYLALTNCKTPAKAGA